MGTMEEEYSYYTDEEDLEAADAMVAKVTRTGPAPPAKAPAVPPVPAPSQPPPLPKLSMSFLTPGRLGADLPPWYVPTEDVDSTEEGEEEEDEEGEYGEEGEEGEEDEDEEGDEADETEYDELTVSKRSDRATPNGGGLEGDISIDVSKTDARAASEATKIPTARNETTPASAGESKLPSARNEKPHSARNGMLAPLGEGPPQNPALNVSGEARSPSPWIKAPAPAAAAAAPEPQVLPPIPASVLSGHNSSRASARGASILDKQVRVFEDLPCSPDPPMEMPVGLPLRAAARNIPAKTTSLQSGRSRSAATVARSQVSSEESVAVGNAGGASDGVEAAAVKEETPLRRSVSGSNLAETAFAASKKKGPVLSQDIKRRLAVRMEQRKAAEARELLALARMQQKMGPVPRAEGLGDAGLRTRIAWQEEVIQHLRVQLQEVMDALDIANETNASLQRRMFKQHDVPLAREMQLRALEEEVGALRWENRHLLNALNEAMTRLEDADRRRKQEAKKAVAAARAPPPKRETSPPPKGQRSPVRPASHSGATRAEAKRERARHERQRAKRVDYAVAALPPPRTSQLKKPTPVSLPAPKAKKKRRRSDTPLYNPRDVLLSPDSDAGLFDLVASSNKRVAWRGAPVARADSGTQFVQREKGLLDRGLVVTTPEDLPLLGTSFAHMPIYKKKKQPTPEPEIGYREQHARDVLQRANKRKKRRPTR